MNRYLYLYGMLCESNAIDKDTIGNTLTFCFEENLLEFSEILESGFGQKPGVTDVFATL